MRQQQTLEEEVRIEKAMVVAFIKSYSISFQMRCWSVVVVGPLKYLAFVCAPLLQELRGKPHLQMACARTLPNLIVLLLCPVSWSSLFASSSVGTKW